MIIVDRFEGDFVVCETEQGMVNLNRDTLPSGLKEGDVLVEKDGTYFVDVIKTCQRKREIERLLHDMLQ